MKFKLLSIKFIRFIKADDLFGKSVTVLYGLFYSQEVYLLNKTKTYQFMCKIKTLNHIFFKLGIKKTRNVSKNAKTK